MVNPPKFVSHPQLNPYKPVPKPLDPNLECGLNVAGRYWLEDINKSTSGNIRY